jgi:3-hydroxyisobutyrate dehydrogenase-like beta-hydroxyacid dehydrogenase
MAQMIHRGGYDLTLWARRAATLEPFADTPAKTAESLRALGESSDLVGVCVLNDVDVEEVTLGSDGLLGGLRKGSIVAIHSTVHPDTCRRIAEEAAKKGVAVLDAPVSGSGESAYANELTVMVGGDRDVFERARPVFETYGEPIRLLGPLGAGQICKLINNMCFIAHLRIAGGTLAMGRELGVEHQPLVDILQASSGQSFAIDALVRRIPPKSIDHVIGLFSKDLGLMADVARTAGVEPNAVEEIAQSTLEMLDKHHR